MLSFLFYFNRNDAIVFRKAYYCILCAIDTRKEKKCKKA
nr:MAG TPA: PROTEIN/RNA Complex.7A [Caudoviricetes sp.]